MAEITIAGIMRAAAFSPNHIGNDAAIFNLVADQLRKRGCIVNVYTEEQLAAGAVTEKIVVNMCREQRSIQTLQAMEDAGTIVINSGYSIENCTRERMARILMGSDIPYPESIIVNTNEAIGSALARASISQCWVKRGDFHTMHKEDVSFARHPEETQELLQEYFMRGITRAVINRHIPGDLVKFYGIRGTSFFYWFNPMSGAPAQETAANTNFNVRQLEEICRRAADEIDIDIFGGDCIISPDGTITMIDFNDWPSFAPCRAQAAPIIARHIISIIRERNSKEK